MTLSSETPALVLAVDRVSIDDGGNSGGNGSTCSDGLGMLIGARS